MSPLSNPVGVSEIAERAGVSPDTVQKWKARDIGFPEPFVILAAGPIWDWPDVQRWLKETNRVR